MDLREKRTKRNIKNAFISLRKTKALERITVKELAELAEISKATFYLHYCDIYDLSDQLQKEVIQDIFEMPYKTAPFSSHLEICQKASEDGCKVILVGEYGNTSVSFGELDNILYDFYFIYVRIYLLAHNMYLVFK